MNESGETTSAGRLKDLVDLVLLIELQSMSPTRIHTAVATTFARRGTHECGMVHTLTSAYERVAAYWRSLPEGSETTV